MSYLVVAKMVNVLVTPDIYGGQISHAKFKIFEGTKFEGNNYTIIMSSTVPVIYIHRIS